MTHYFNLHSWPSGFQSPTTEELSKGLPVDAARLELVKEMHARKTALFQELIGQGVVPLRPGILRIVDEAIADDVPLAVCSTSNEAAVRTLVRTLMGDARYERFSFFCGDVVPKKKPAPDVYNLAAETMKLDKSTCVVIEDSGIGNKAAKAAEMACLVTCAAAATATTSRAVRPALTRLGAPSEQLLTPCATLPVQDEHVHRRRRLHRRRPDRPRAGRVGRRGDSDALRPARAACMSCLVHPTRAGVGGADGAAC